MRARSWLLNTSAAAGLLLATLLVLPFAAGACAEPARELTVAGYLDLVDYVGEAADRARGGVANALYPELRDELMRAEKTSDVFVTDLARMIVFDGLSAPGNATLELSLRILPPEAYAEARLGALFRARTTDGVLHEERGTLQLEQEGNPEGWVEVRHAFALEGSLDRIEVGFPARGADPGARLALLRPRLRFQQAVAAASGAPRQVVLVTVDTLRPDFLGCYGNSAVSTPAFDALAAEGVRFDAAYSTTNGTNPGHVSIFTSLHLSDHNVKDNFTALAAECPTLIEALRQAGFRTAAFVSSASFQPERCGLDRRFDDYFPCEIYFERRAEDVNADLYGWLARNAGADFFVWVHYFDAHMPYAPPAPFDGMYRSQGERRIEHSSYAEAAAGASQSELLHDYVDRYMGEISYLDRQLGLLVDSLKQLEIYERAWVIVVGDHGESLGENRIFLDHVGLYEPSTRVPFLWKAPLRGESGERGGRAVSGLVSILDVYPTLFAALGLSSAHPLRGRDLAPAMAAGRSARERLVLEHGRGEQLAVRTERWLLLRDTTDREFFPGFGVQAGRVQLFDLAADPGAETDVAAAHPEVVGELEAVLDAHRAQALDLDATTIDDPEYMQRLRALGYVK